MRIEEFDGAPAVREALEILIVSYDKMDLKELADADPRRCIAANYEAEAGEQAARAEAQVVEALAGDADLAV